MLDDINGYGALRPLPEPSTEADGKDLFQWQQRLRAVAGDRAALTIDEAAALMGIDRRHLYAAARSGDLPVLRFGRRIFVGLGVLEKMLGGTQ